METQYCDNCNASLGSESIQKFCSYKCKVQHQLSELKKKKRIKNENQEYIRILVEDLIERSYLAGDTTIDGKWVNYYLLPGFNSRKKEEILERDDYECQICGKLTQLHIHHIIPRKQGGNHKNDNLITLCARCHGAIESKDIVQATNTCYNNFLRNGKTYSASDKRLAKMETRLKIEELIEIFAEIEEKSFTEVEKREVLIELVDLAEIFD